jgi:hypothetical protein
VPRIIERGTYQGHDADSNRRYATNTESPGFARDRFGWCQRPTLLFVPGDLR